MSKSSYAKKKFYSIYRELNRQTYEAEKRRLAAELLKLQHWVVENKKRVAITFDGRDAAGKGGTMLNAINHHANFRPPKKKSSVVFIRRPKKAPSTTIIAKYPIMIA